MDQLSSFYTSASCLLIAATLLLSVWLMKRKPSHPNEFQGWCIQVDDEEEFRIQMQKSPRFRNRVLKSYLVYAYCSDIRGYQLFKCPWEPYGDRIAPNLVGTTRFQQIITLMKKMFFVHSKTGDIIMSERKLNRKYDELVAEHGGDS